MIICSGATGDMYETQLNIMKPTVEAYGDRHQIDTIFFQKRFDESRPASWDKVIILYNLLRYYEIVMWMDADAIFLDAKWDIRDELNDAYPVFMVTHIGRDPIWPNGGLIVAKRNKRTFKFLEEVWNQTDAIDHIWWEQQAIFSILGYKNNNHYILSHHETKFTHMIGALDLKWNSRPIDQDVSDSPIIMHYCGLPHEIRIKEMISCQRIFFNRLKHLEKNS